MNQIARPAVLLALLLFTPLAAAPATASPVAAAPAGLSIGDLLATQRLDFADQDFERDRACLRNLGPEATWTPDHHVLGFVISHDLAVPPRDGDVKVGTPAGLRALDVEIQDEVVVVALTADADGYTFLKDGLTCIDLHGLDYVDHVAHGRFAQGIRIVEEAAD